MELAEIYVKKQDNINTFENNLGLYNGTIFKDLYKPYKHENQKNKTFDKKENLSLTLKELNFSIIDMNLYLLTHVNDIQAIKKLKEYISEYRRLLIYYEKEYGPLDIYSQFIGGNQYNYGVDNRVDI